MKRIVTLIVLLLLISLSYLGNTIVSTKNKANVQLPVKITDTATQIYSETNPINSPTLAKTLSITSTVIIPDTIVKNAIYTGMTPEEIMETYLMIHNAIEADDPSTITDLIPYPLMGCQRCGGRTVETPNDFIKLYYDKLDEGTRRIIYSQNPQNLFMNYNGVMFGNGQLWFSKYCKNDDLQSCKIYIIKFMDYCTYHKNEETIIKVDQTNFVFGKYKVKTFKEIGGSALEEKQINEILSAQIEINPNSYFSNSNGWFGNSCESATIEFCPEKITKFTDMSAIGRMNIVCGENLIQIFDLKSESEFIMYIDGYNFFLDNIPQ